MLIWRARVVPLDQFTATLTLPSIQVDYEMALEYATQSGVSEEPRETIYIQSLEAENKMIDLQTPFIVFRVFQ